MQPTDNYISTDPYFFPLIEDTGFGLPVGPQLFRDSGSPYFPLLENAGFGPLAVGLPDPFLIPMQSNISFATDPYIFPLIEEPGFDLLPTPTPHLLPDPLLLQIQSTPDPYSFPLIENTGIASTDPSHPAGPSNLSCLAEGSLGYPLSIAPQGQNPSDYFHDCSNLKAVTGTIQGNVNETTTLPPRSVTTPTTPAQRPRKARMKRRERMNSEEERIAFLENDEFVVSFTEALVTCSKCTKSIKLDTRDGARFYVTAWERHRGRCKKINQGEKMEHLKEG